MLKLPHEPLEGFLAWPIGADYFAARLFLFVCSPCFLPFFLCFILSFLLFSFFLKLLNWCLLSLFFSVSLVLFRLFSFFLSFFLAFFLACLLWRALLWLLLLVSGLWEWWICSASGVGSSGSTVTQCERIQGPMRCHNTGLLQRLISN